MKGFAKIMLLAFAITGTLSVFSQPITDSAGLRTQINADIVTNGTKAITAAKLNRILQGYLNIWATYGVDSFKVSTDTLFYRKNKTWRFAAKFPAGGTGIDSLKLSNDSVFARKNSVWVFQFKFTSTGTPTVFSSSATSLTLSTYNTYIFTGSAATTWTLPAIGTIGRTYRIKNRGSANITIQRAGSDSIYHNTAVTSILVLTGEAIELQDDGTYWITF